MSLEGSEALLHDHARKFQIFQGLHQVALIPWEAYIAHKAWT